MNATIYLGLACGLALVLAAAPAFADAAAQPVTRITVSAEVLNPVDDRLFGQFMEVASWGEPGPDAVVDPATGELPDDVVELLEWMNIPVIRWPGGTDVDSIDWTDRIDGALNREGGGPRVPTAVGGNTLSNAMSHDAFLRLCERLDAEPMLVLNLKAVLSGQRTLEEAKQHAAAFVAYSNAKTDADLPEELLAWARLREANGRAEPWDVPYVQIGNESWFYTKALAEAAGHTELPDQMSWLADHVVAIAEAMKAVDPEIEFIFDSNVGPGVEPTEVFYADPRVIDVLDYSTFHAYFPMENKTVWRGEEKVEADDLTAEELFYAWQFGPGRWLDTGMVPTDPTWRADEIDLPLAQTEWNWNGWGGSLRIAENPREVGIASALAVGSYLNGLMRLGDRFVIANQSMLVGTSWGITAVRVDPTGKNPPFLMPTGLTTGLFSRHHGNQRLSIDIENLPTTDLVSDLQVQNHLNAQPIQARPFPLLDVVATADAEAVYLHIVHRRYEGAMPLSVDLSSLMPRGEVPAVVHRIEPRGRAHPPGVIARDSMAHVHLHGSAVRDGQLDLTLPAQSISIVRIPRAGEATPPR